MAEITVRLFGAFRNLQAEPEIQVRVPESVATIGEFRTWLGESWKRQELKVSFDLVGLLANSAIADEKKILLDDQRIEGGQKLALLPPVSGG